MNEILLKTVSGLMCVSILSGCTGSGDSRFSENSADSMLDSALSDVVSSVAEKTASDTEYESSEGEISGTPAVFIDSSLKKCVRKTLGLDEDTTLTEEMCEQITDLDCTDYYLSTLEDMHFFPNLETLYISNYDYNLNLKGINKAIKLKKLTLQNCCLTDLERIGDLSDLEYLDISSWRQTNINDYQPLTRLKKLKYLDLSWNDNYYNERYLADGSFLADLESLEELNVYGTSIGNIPFSQMKSLKKITFNHFSSDDVLKQLIDGGIIGNIEVLNMPCYDYNKKITDNGLSQYLPQAKKLKCLFICTDDLTSLAPFEKMSSLKELVISNYSSYNLDLYDFNSIGKISSLEKLEILYAIPRPDDGNSPNDYAFLNSLTDLKYLKISAFDGMTIACLDNLKNLEVLDLDGWLMFDPMVDCSDVSELESLKQLRYRRINFKSTAPFDDMENLILDEYTANGDVSITENW